jgi:hypothetical protein
VVGPGVAVVPSVAVHYWRLLVTLRDDSCCDSGEEWNEAGARYGSNLFVG